MSTFLKTLTAILGIDAVTSGTDAITIKGHHVSLTTVICSSLILASRQNEKRQKRRLIFWNGKQLVSQAIQRLGSKPKSQRGHHSQSIEILAKARTMPIRHRSS